MLERHGIEPAPERSRKTTWKELLRRRWGLIVAADFFAIEAWTLRGLQRFVILFFMDLSTRKVEIAGIASIPDRDPLFTAQFLKMLAETGVASVKLPPRSPNLNAQAERFVWTIKEACLKRMILFGEGAVRKATAEFIAHYHSERNHQGLDNTLICPDPGHAVAAGKVHRRERLSGPLQPATATWSASWCTVALIDNANTTAPTAL